MAKSEYSIVCALLSTLFNRSPYLLLPLVTTLSISKDRFSSTCLDASILFSACSPHTVDHGTMAAVGVRRGFRHTVRPIMDRVRAGAAMC